MQTWISPRWITQTSRLALALVALASVVGCSVSSPMRTIPLYERLGGKGGLVTLTADLSARIVQDDRLRARFASTQMHVFEKKLAEQLCALSGGPCRYGGLDMRAAHAGMGITHAEFDALMENLRQSMQRFRIPETEQKALLDLLSPMRKDVVG